MKKLILITGPTTMQNFMLLAQCAQLVQNMVNCRQTSTEMVLKQACTQKE